MKSVLIFSVMALYLGPAKGKIRQDKDHHKIGLEDGPLSRDANLTLPPLMALGDISFAPATDWKGSMGLGVAYRFYRAKPPTVGSTSKHLSAHVSSLFFLEYRTGTMLDSSARDWEGHRSLRT